MRPLAAVLVCCAVQGVSIAQSFRFSPQWLPVFGASGHVLENPFSGGINGPRMQFVDIDGDGDFDLFITDAAGSLTFYENTGSPTAPAWTLRSTDFQSLHATRWARFVDLNGDGAFDLVCAGPNGTVEFFRNTGTSHVPVFASPAEPLLDIAGNPMRSEEQCVPAFCDIDNDGDMDFLTGSSLGSITLYENVGTRFQPSFVFRTAQWQGIKIISPAGPPDNGTPTPQHGANVLAFADLDHDGDQDLLFGDLYTKGLLYFVNASTDGGRTARIVVDSLSYPRNADSVRTSGFNGAAVCDIDGDGNDDLFVGPLLAASHSLWYYHNDGTPVSPDYHRVTKDFLPMIDAGSGSRVAVGDVNGDGLADLIVGSQQGLVQYCENTGSRTHPVWTHRTDSLVNVFAAQNVAPALADLDGDGRLDLVLGTAAGTLQWYRNESTADHVQFSFADQTPVQDVQVAQNATPAFFDVDGDGDLDMLVGQASGQLSFYLNDGTKNAPHFTHVRNALDSLVSGFVQPQNSAPCFIDADGDGHVDLLVGRNDGTLRFFRGAADAPAFTVGAARDTFGGIVVQGDAAPGAADIDGDGDPDFFIGTRLGGVAAFENLARQSKVAMLVVESPRLRVWPEPASDEIHVEEYEGRAALEVIDVLGRCVIRSAMPAGDDLHAMVLSLRGIPPGWYVAQCHGGENRVPFLHIR